MYREETKKEREIETFYLDTPEEKIFYPIDLEWNEKLPSVVSMESKLKVNLEDGKKTDLQVKEVDLKKYRKGHKTNGK